MQESALSCWATAGEMIMTYWNEHQNWQGPVRRQCEQMMHEYPYVNCCDITSATPMPIDCGLGGWPQFPDWGLSCSVNSGHPLSWDDLRSEIDAARPFTYSGPYPVNHMVVVVAYDTTRTRQRITVLMPDGGQPTDTVTILYSDYAARHKPYQQDYYNIHPAPSTP